jgi:hypothetical protein
MQPYSDIDAFLNSRPRSFRNSLIALVLAVLQQKSSFDEIMSGRDEIPSQGDFTGILLK